MAPRHFIGIIFALPVYRTFIMRSVILSFLLPLLAVSTYAQTIDTAKRKKYFIVPAETFYATKRDKPFPLHDKLQTIDGKQIDFGHLDKPTFVCFGFYGCHPCMHELPIFIEMASERSDINFVYITFDSEVTRQREFAEAGLKDYKPVANYYIIHLDRADIDKAKLTMGYPTKYFLNKDGIVKTVECGGNPTLPVQEVKDHITEVALLQ